MPGTSVCRIAAVVATLGGLGAALVVGGEIAGKLIDLGMVADTWRFALTLISGIVGASIGGGSALAGSGCWGRDPSPDRRTRRLVAVAWLPILVGAVITPIGDFLAWAGVTAWVTGLALQLAGIMRARGQRTA